MRTPLPSLVPILTLVSGLWSLDSLCAAPFEPAPPVKATNGLELREFAKEPFLKNTVALCVDEEGRVYATSVVRRKAADLDIRQFRAWIPTDLSLTSVDAKREFYHRELAPGKNAHKQIGDQNKDGSIDWKDLTVLSDRIIRLEDTDHDGVADQAGTFAEGFNTEVTGIAAGITAWDGTIYATVEPDTWKLEDRNGDGVSDARESLAHGFSVHVAYAGHNFSGPVVGPDGRLYMSSADKGMNVTSKEGVNYAHPHSGTIARCELDGSNFEVFAYGLRNVQEPAFDQFGNLFGVDNDGDMKGEKERLLYITEGSDTGWRCNWQYRGKDYQIWQEEGLYVPEHPKQAAYITPCLQVYHDGPTGFAFNPGTALNPFYKDHFFMTAFPGRKLYAFKLKPKGATFELVGDHVVSSGVLMTGLGFGPDGALYVADWSAKGYELNDKGGVWKLDDPSQAGSKARQETWNLIRADWSKPDAKKLAEFLGHDDQRVRMKAQFEFARRQDKLSLSTVALDTERPLLARLHAIWGLGQILRRPNAGTSDRFTPLLADSDPEVRAQAAKVVSEIPALRAAATTGLVKLLRDPAPRPAFFAAIAIGRLQVPGALDALVMYLAERGDDPYLRHAGMMALLGCTTPAQLAGLAAHEAKPVRLAAIVALRRLRAPEVAVFLGDQDPIVVAEAARAIHDDESIPSALQELAQQLQVGKNLEEATARRALSAAIRLRKPEHAKLVADYAANAEHPEEIRARALDLLTQWPAPEPLDSVEGRYRPLRPIRAAKLRPAVQSQLTALANDKSKDLAERARRAGAVYGIGTDPKDLLATVKADGEGAADALGLLAGTDPAIHADAAQIGIKSSRPEVRAAALVAIARTTPDQLSKHAADAFKGKSILEQRTALELLGTSTDPECARLLTINLAALRTGDLIDPALALDLLEAAAASEDPEVKKSYLAYQSGKDSTDPLAPFIETMQGGDPEKGKDLFNNHVAAQCVRCHMIGGGGSEVGPALDKIGEKEPKYLLESLLVPGAVVAPGYGVTSITLKNGEVVSGTLLTEDAEAVTVRLATEPEPVQIQKATIASQTPPASAMPPIGLLLQKKELRDLLAYLQTLK